MRQRMKETKRKIPEQIRIQKVRVKKVLPLLPVV